MAYTGREMAAGPADVFAVLLDPHTYPDWLVGTSEIRDVDAAWPRLGSRFHHVVGLGPFKVRDFTEVLALEENELLRLKVRARPFIWAVATFRIVGQAGSCVVTLEEEPDVRIIGNLVRPVLDPTTHVRNHRSLKRLADVVTSRRR